jgi:hypothetical protein
MKVNRPSVKKGKERSEDFKSKDGEQNSLK